MFLASLAIQQHFCCHNIPGSKKLATINKILHLIVKNGPYWYSIAAVVAFTSHILLYNQVLYTTYMYTFWFSSIETAVETLFCGT